MVTVGLAWRFDDDRWGRVVEEGAMVQSPLRWFSKVGRNRSAGAQGDGVVVDARGISCRCQELPGDGSVLGSRAGAPNASPQQGQLSCFILQETLREKELLIREIHHRVKNNLQVISSLLNLQGRASRSVDAQRACEESQLRIKSIALIHELLYRSENMSRISASEYLSKLGTKLLSGFGLGGRVNLTIDSSDASIDLDHAVPFGLVVNELFTNSMKHGFPNGRCGTIAVKLRHSSEGNVALEFKDDGVGLAAEIDPLTHDSLGFRLMGSLVRQLDGTIEFIRGRGVECVISFPLQKFTQEDTCQEK